MNDKALYPKVFMTPDGRRVGVKQFSVALKVIRANREAEYPGWNWYQTPGWMILNSVRRGIHDRINRR